MSETKPDCYCTLQDLKDITVLPYGWVMMKRSEGGVADLEDFEIKLLGGADPLMENANLRGLLAEAQPYINVQFPSPKAYDIVENLNNRIDAILARD